MATVGLDHQGQQWSMSTQERRRSLTPVPMLTVNGFGGRMPAYIKISLSLSIPTLSLECTAGTKRCVSLKRKSADQYGDIHVDTDKSRAGVQKWLKDDTAGGTESLLMAPAAHTGCYDR